MKALLRMVLVVGALVVSDAPSWWVKLEASPAAALADKKDKGERRRDQRNGKRKKRAKSGDGTRDETARPDLARGPYLQMGTSDGITIRWQTADPSPSLVRYGTSPNQLEFRAEDDAPATAHEVRLTNLQPDTRYFYTVGTPDGILAGGPDCCFRTAPPSGAERTVRIWVIGDSGLRGPAQQRVQQAYDAYSQGADTDVWLLLGDNAYTTGTSQQYQAGFFGPYRQRLRGTPVWPARGNHDLIRTGPGNDYYDFFTLPKGAEAGGAPSATEAYYSFDYANVHFVCLDAEQLEEGHAMIDWLRADLASTKKDWIVAYWHHAPYSKGSHDSDTEPVMIQARRELLPVLEQGGVDLVVCGHSHSYERSYLLDGHYGPSGSLKTSMIKDRGDGRPDGSGPYRKPTLGRPAPHEGTVYVVVGSSSKRSGGPLDHRAHAKSLDTLGSLALVVTGKRLDASFVDDQQRVPDRFSITKGDGAARDEQAMLDESQDPPSSERGSR